MHQALSITTDDRTVVVGAEFVPALRSGLERRSAPVVRVTPDVYLVIAPTAPGVPNRIASNIARFYGHTDVLGNAFFFLDDSASAGRFDGLLALVAEFTRQAPTRHSGRRDDAVG